MNRPACKGCRYHGAVISNYREKGCLYCHDTGEPRDCEAGEGCKRYRPGSRKKPEMGEIA